MNEQINTELYNLVVRFLKLIDTEDFDFYNRNIELFNEAMTTIKQINTSESN